MPSNTVQPENIAASSDIVSEGIAAIQADTSDLNDEISALNSLIHELVKVGNITPAQLSSAMQSAFESDLSEEDMTERLTLAEDKCVEAFIETYR